MCSCVRSTYVVNSYTQYIWLIGGYLFQILQKNLEKFHTQIENQIYGGHIF